MGIENPPNTGTLATEIAKEIAENDFTVVIVTPLDETGNRIADDAVTYDPHEFGITGHIDEDN